MEDNGKIINKIDKSETNLMYKKKKKKELTQHIKIKDIHTKKWNLLI